MRRFSLCLVVCLLCSACERSSDEGDPARSLDEGDPARSSDEGDPAPQHAWRGFPVLPPIANADPTIREDRQILVATQLRIVRSESGISVEADPDSLESITLSVGANMVAGFRIELFVYRDGQLLSGGGSGLGGDWYFGSFNYTTSGFGFPKPGETYEIELKTQIFETDIPPQHMWMPGSPKYKVLWTHSFRQGT